MKIDFLTRANTRRCSFYPFDALEMLQKRRFSFPLKVVCCQVLVGNKCAGDAFMVCWRVSTMGVNTDFILIVECFGEIVEVVDVCTSKTDGSGFV